MLLRLAAVTVALLALAACGGGKQAATSAATSTAASLTPGCEVPAAERGFVGLLDAITAGGAARIAGHLSPAGEFTGLKVVDARGSFTTSSRAKAVAYLAARHRSRDRLRLLQLIVAQGADARHDALRFTVSRVATDVRRGIAIGTGSFDCVHGTISALNLRGP